MAAGTVAALAMVTALRFSDPTPVEALARFSTHGGEPDSFVAEDMLMDPLILAGPAVVPLVLEQVPKRSMPRRRYAIGFLGNGPYVEALPVLRKILGDNAEQDLIRGNALNAICSIDAIEGRTLALAFVAQGNYLASTAKHIVESRCEVRHRTYAQAATGCHDCE